MQILFLLTFIQVSEKNDFGCLLIEIGILAIGFFRSHGVSTEEEFLEYRKVTEFLISIKGFFG